MSPTSSPHLTTAPGYVTLSLGGVSANVAGSARSLGISDVLLVAPISDDLFGLVARKGLKERGMREDGLVEIEGGTATCGILLDERGELVGGVADMEIAERVTGEQVRDFTF